MREYFTFYRSYLEAVMRVPKAQRNELLMAIILMAIGDEYTEPKGSVSAPVFEVIKHSIKANISRSQKRGYSQDTGTSLASDLQDTPKSLASHSEVTKTQKSTQENRVERIEKENIENRGKSSRGRECKETTRRMTAGCQEPPPLPLGEEELESTLELYNGHCTSLPQIKAMSENRAQALSEFKQTMCDGDSNKLVQMLNKLFVSAQSSAFLCGDNPKTWRADFDWLIQPKNALKVLEGKYDSYERKTEQSERTLSENEQKSLDEIKKYMNGVKADEESSV